MTQNDTPEIALRIRIKSLPTPGEFDEFDLRPYRIGGTYELPLRLASLLILGGYAERGRFVNAGRSRRLRPADVSSPEQQALIPRSSARYACLIQPLERCSASVHC